MYTITYKGKYLDYIDNYFIPHMAAKSFGEFIGKNETNQEEDNYIIRDIPTKRNNIPVLIDFTIAVGSYAKHIDDYLYNIPLKIYKKKPIEFMDVLEKWCGKDKFKIIDLSNARIIFD